MDIMQQYAYLVIHRITYNSYVSLFNCEKVGQASDTMANPCADPENFVRGGATLSCFFS